MFTHVYIICFYHVFIRSSTLAVQSIFISGTTYSVHPRAIIQGAPCTLRWKHCPGHRANSCESTNNSMKLKGIKHHNVDSKAKSMAKHQQNSTNKGVLNLEGFQSLMRICARSRHDATCLAIKAHEVYALSRTETRFFALGYPEQFDWACHLSHFHTFPSLIQWQFWQPLICTCDVSGALLAELNGTRPFSSWATATGSHRSSAFGISEWSKVDATSRQLSRRQYYVEDEWTGPCPQCHNVMVFSQPFMELFS